MQTQSALAANGTLGLRVVRASEKGIVRKAPLSWRLNNLIFHRSRAFWEVIGMWLAHQFGIAVIKSELRLVLYKATGEVIDYGLVSTRKVTQAGLGYLVDAWNGTGGAVIGNMKYHAFGTGAGAEDPTNTTITEITPMSDYTGSVRPTGSLEEGASGWIWKSVATHTDTAGNAVTEHAIVTTNTGAYVMLDRHLFGTITLGVGDSLQATYSLTLTPEA